MAVSSIVAAIQALLTSLGEVDEINQERLPDGRVKVTALVTGINPNAVKWKVYAWALFGLPAQKVDEVVIEELQGNILKRYKVEIVLRPLFEVKRLGFIDMLLNKGVKVRREQEF